MAEDPRLYIAKQIALRSRCICGRPLDPEGIDFVGEKIGLVTCDYHCQACDNHLTIHISKPFQSDNIVGGVSIKETDLDPTQDSLELFNHGPITSDDVLDVRKAVKRLRISNMDKIRS